MSRGTLSNRAASTTSPGAARRPRSAVSLVEVLIGVGLFSVLVCGVVWVLGYGSRSTARVSAQMSLQQASRKALVKMLRELREGMEVVSPLPGSTLSYALFRDKVSLVRWFYQVPQKNSRGLFELWRYVNDSRLPDGQRHELLLQNVKRLTFSCRSEGALQVNLTLTEEDREYSMLTTVRLQNIASSEELW
ncbi:MAG: hypothetical protein HY815_07225 [Candidatus Riflebacteria bacterium]|nr:hypothetical protein [Candidatus Riflebacteria bacterium]